jgi:hypothetical protein
MLVDDHVPHAIVLGVQPLPWPVLLGRIEPVPHAQSLLLDICGTFCISTGTGVQYKGDLLVEGRVPHHLLGILALAMREPWLIPLPHRHSVLPFSQRPCSQLVPLVHKSLHKVLLVRR